MVFWSFLAGVVTLYCSVGPDSLLPNIFVSIKPKTKVVCFSLPRDLKFERSKFSVMQSLPVKC